ncbi:MAG: twin-arginine translocation signal domain-containing protein [Atopobiaceae bacterium]|nr:twin-arginine translocation signal domain-containing protein [Atopobiaceae bacterium]
MFKNAQRLLSRRRFLAGSAGTAAAATTLGACTKTRQQAKAPVKLAIVHTNDTHVEKNTIITLSDGTKIGFFGLEDTYTNASIDFLCAGGDAYYVFAKAAQDTMKTIDYLQYDCLQHYFQEACGGTVPEEYADPAGQGRIETIV